MFQARYLWRSGAPLFLLVPLQSQAIAQTCPGSLEFHTGQEIEVFRYTGFSGVRGSLLLSSGVIDCNGLIGGLWFSEDAAPLDETAPLSACGGMMSVPLFTPAIGCPEPLVEDQDVDGGGTIISEVSIKVSGDAEVIADSRKIRVSIDLKSCLEMGCNDTDCKDSAFPRAQAKIEEWHSVNVPFTVTSPMAQFLMTPTVDLREVPGELPCELMCEGASTICDSSSATLIWSIDGIGGGAGSFESFGEVSATGPDGVQSSPSQGCIDDGDYRLTLTLTDIADEFVCAPPCGADGAVCSHNPKFTFSLVVVDCIGDVNGDGTVNVQDLTAVILAWGDCSGDCPADINGDGTVNVTDLTLVNTNWGECTACQ